MEHFRRHHRSIRRSPQSFGKSAALLVGLDAAIKPLVRPFTTGAFDAPPPLGRPFATGEFDSLGLHTAVNPLTRPFTTGKFDSLGLHAAVKPLTRPFTTVKFNSSPNFARTPRRKEAPGRRAVH
eukprot:7515756-Pyramimonas_sp.AAC.1